MGNYSSMKPRERRQANGMGASEAKSAFGAEGALPTSAQLGRDEIVAILESESAKRLGVSAKAMLRDFTEGHLDSPGDVADLLVFADLLSEDDPLVVGD